MNEESEFIFGFHFRIHGDVAIIVLERTSQAQLSQFRRRGSVMDGNEIGNQTFFLELKIVSAKKSKFNQLQWKHYSVSFCFLIHFSKIISYGLVWILDNFFFYKLVTLGA